MQIDVKAGQTWRNKRTGQDYEVVLVVSEITGIERPMVVCYQAGTLRKVSGERLFRCPNSYYTKSQTDLGELVFYKGETGEWARTIEDFQRSFEVINE